ncbi:hypothetical protein CALLAN_57 [Paenibacillus phage Callan]|nr:hypothetical protein CALLAN_57 [Paenibacillus phage Callan]UYL93345.1 hypothetical protein DASH_59 [Paenibacillus phage Dash]
MIGEVFLNIPGSSRNLYQTKSKERKCREWLKSA